MFADGRNVAPGDYVRHRGRLEKIVSITPATGFITFLGHEAPVLFADVEYVGRMSAAQVMSEGIEKSKSEAQLDETNSPQQPEQPAP